MWVVEEMNRLGCDLKGLVLDVELLLMVDDELMKA